MMLSPWTQRTVDTDPFGPNPPLEALKVEQPGVAEAALRGGPAPTLFVGGDLPAFTASGLDPAVLNNFPWQMRHAAAAEANPATVYSWLQEFTKDGMHDISHPGLHSFMSRITDWATTSGTKKVTPPEEIEATYAALFGTEGNN